MKVAILLVALVASASCMTLMEKYPVNFNEKRSIMNLMVQIEAHIKAGGPMDAITTILDEFEKEIKDEQIAANELHEENQASCAEELTFRENAIREADLALREATETLDSCVAQLARAESDLKAANNQLSALRLQLGQLERTRLDEELVYNNDIIAFKALDNGIQEAIKMIDEMAAGNASFIQVSKHMNKVILMAAEVKQVQNMAQVMTALVQIKDSNTDALFIQLKGMFEDFYKTNSEEHQKCIDRELAAIAHYNQTKARLTSTIAKLVQQIEDLEAEIAELKKCVTVQTNLQSAARSKLTRNTNLKNSATAVCEASVRSYNQQKAARADELELLVAIKAKVHERYGQISNEHGTIDRGEATADEIANSYENASAYDNKKFEGI